MNLTSYEMRAISGRYNFADGHARYRSPLSPEQFLHMLSDFTKDGHNQLINEAAFHVAFFALAGQNQAANPQNCLYCPSASVSIELVANYLRIRGMTVALIEPVFDNLADILRRHNIPLVPIADSLLGRGLSEVITTIDADAIFLVLPNNPTGSTISSVDFENIVHLCAAHDKLLILDFSFRFFCPAFRTWNQYAVLFDSRVRFISIEDTGKTWSTSELKVSPILSDDFTHQAILSIYSDLFIAHSPFVLSVVEKVIRDTIDNSLENTILSIVDANRQLLRQSIPSELMIPRTTNFSSVEWLQVVNGMTDLEWEHKLRQYEVYVLPGRKFFWSNHKSAYYFIRIALMRDPDVFKYGVERLQDAFNGLKGTMRNVKIR